MSKIFMEVENVQASCRSLELNTRSFDNEANELKRAIRQLDAAWDGGQSNRFVRDATDLARKLEKQIELLNILSRRGYLEVEEWERVDLYFSKLDLNFQTLFAIPPGVNSNILEKPTNMQDLARLTMDGPDPIRIEKVGENEYLVIIGGTILDPNANNNWGSAIQSGLGIPTDFQLRVAAALLALPAGAALHFSGYSQGGIVAQNLAKDPQFKNNVISVTTFGSPSMGGVSKDTNLTMFAADGDIVPMLEHDKKLLAILVGSFMPFSTFPKWLLQLLDNDTQEHISGTPGNFIDDHGVYKNSDELKNKPLPFTIKDWDGKPILVDPGLPNSGLSAVYKNTIDSVNSGFEQVNNFFDDTDWL